MLNTGESNEPGLFTYVVLLDLGVIFILLRKNSWIVLEPLSLVGTYIIYFSWFSTYYTPPPETLLTLIFLALFWAIFHGLDMFRVITAPASFAEVRRVVAALHAPLFFGTLFSLINPHFHSQMGIAAAVASAFYFGSAVPLERRRPGADSALTQYTLTAVIFLALAAAIEFERFTIAMFWTAEADILIWAGVRNQRRYLWTAGLVLFGVTALTLLALRRIARRIIVGGISAASEPACPGIHLPCRISLCLGVSRPQRDALWIDCPGGSAPLRMDSPRVHFADRRNK